MQRKHNKQLVPLAKQLRREMTKEERHLWYDFLRDHPVRFSRQKVLGKYIADWKAIGLGFEAIQTGFLSSQAQMDFVVEFIGAFKSEHTFVAVDPVMGDYGKLYTMYDPALAARMPELLNVADVLTPNLTEAYILAKRRFVENPSENELVDLAEELCVKNARCAVIPER